MANGISRLKFPRPRRGVRRRAGANLHFDGRLVPIVPHAADCDGGDSVFAYRRFAGARLLHAFFHGHFHDRLHGRSGHRGAQFHHPRDFIEMRLRKVITAEAVVEQA